MMQRLGAERTIRHSWAVYLYQYCDQLHLRGRLRLAVAAIQTQGRRYPILIGRTSI